jgi:hypothetical protein
MNIIQNLKAFFKQPEDTKTKIQDTGAITIHPSRPLSFGKINLRLASDDRVNPQEVLLASKDGIVNQCVKLIINSTLSNGYILKCKYKNQEEKISKLIDKIDFKKQSKKILNSILGSNGDIFSFVSEDKDGNLELIVESVFKQGYKRILLNIDKSHNQLINKIIVQNETQNKLYTLDIDYVHQVVSPHNLDNELLGQTPLMLIYHRVIEKMAWIKTSKNRGLKGGVQEGIFTPPDNIFDGVDLKDKLNYLAEFSNTITVLNEQEKKSYLSYATSPIPLKFLSLSRSNLDEQYLENIRDINYEICSTYGVPTSLVQFHPDTDPNLSNSSQYRDNFAELNTNEYKTVLEEFWNWFLKTQFPFYEFELVIGREQTDETIKLRDQLFKSIEACEKLQGIGINAKPKLELIEKLGLELVNEKEDEQEELDTSLDLVDDLEMSNKAVNSETLDEVFKKYYDTVNMSYSELENWSQNECSKLASLDRSPIRRNLRLLNKNKDQWTEKDIKDANRTISFVSRMRKMPNGKVIKDCYSKRDISLKNWAFDPNQKYKELENLNNNTKEIKKKIQPPNINNFLKSKEFKTFKFKIGEKLSSQIESFFNSKTKSIKDSNLFKEVFDDISKISLTPDDLSKLIKKEILPKILKEYNEFYKTDFSLENLPRELTKDLEDLTDLTINGNFTKTYLGVDSTTSAKISLAYTNILKNKGFSLDAYSSLPEQFKKTIWNELKLQSKELILESRTDLLSVLITQQTYNKTLEKLSKVQGWTFVGVTTVRDNNVRLMHSINEGKYFATFIKQPWLDPNCRCTYIFGNEPKLLELGFETL